MQKWSILRMQSRTRYSNLNDVIVFYVSRGANNMTEAERHRLQEHPEAAGKISIQAHPLLLL